MFNFNVAALSGFLVNNFDFFVSFLIKLYNWGIWEEGKSKKSFLGLPCSIWKAYQKAVLPLDFRKVSSITIAKKTSWKLERHLLFHFTKVWPMLICPIFTPTKHVLICWAFPLNQHLQSERYLDNAGRQKPGWRNTPQPYEALCHWTDSCSKLAINNIKYTQWEQKRSALADYVCMRTKLIMLFLLAPPWIC